MEARGSLHVLPSRPATGEGVGGHLVLQRPSLVDRLPGAQRLVPRARAPLPALPDRQECDAGPHRAVLAEATAEAERAGVPGYYAYRLPTYREHPDQDTGRFPIKVGRSDVDVHNRFAAQKRLTWLPEEPELLRVFTCGPERSIVDLERRLHEALDEPATPAPTEIG